MATNFYVTKENTCPKCKGWKFVQESNWKHYWGWNIKFKISNDREPTQAEDREWWMNLGFEYDQIPPEEIPCPGCGGDGVVSEKFLLADALRELERI